MAPNLSRRVLRLTIASLIAGQAVAEEPTLSWLDGFSSQVEGCFAAASAPVCLEQLRWTCIQAAEHGSKPADVTADGRDCGEHLLHSVQALLIAERMKRLVWAGKVAETALGAGERDALDSITRADAAWAEFSQAECWAVSASWGAGTARGGWLNNCLLRLTAERVEHLRSFHPDTLSLEDFLKD